MELYKTMEEYEKFVSYAFIFGIGYLISQFWFNKELMQLIIWISIIFYIILYLSRRNIK